MRSVCLCVAHLSLVIPLLLPALALGALPPDYILQWGSEGDGIGEMRGPADVCLDPAGDVYVVEYLGGRVQRFSADGKFLNFIGSPGTAPGQFAYPQGVAADDLGNVYVADGGNNRIQKFSSTGIFQLTWGTSGSGDGQLQSPIGLVVDDAGDVFVVDSGNHRVQKFSSVGVYLDRWPVGDGFTSDPHGIAYDPGGILYITDVSRHRIERYTVGGTFLSSWGSQGSAYGQFSYPQGVAFDGNNSVYVGDTGNARVQRFTKTGGFEGAWGWPGDGNGEFQGQIGVAIGPDAKIYTTEQLGHRVQKFGHAAKDKIYWTDFGTEVMTGVIRRSNLDASSPENLASPGALNTWGLAVDHSEEKLYWVEPLSEAIVRANADGTNPEQLYTAPAGQRPLSIDLDLFDGKMYWIETGGFQIIRRANLDGSLVQDLVTGVELDHPNFIAVDHGLGKMYWTDSGTDKIRRANLDGTGIEDVIAAGFPSPYGIELDVPAGKMYWTDTFYDTIYRANLDGTGIEDLEVTGLINPYDLALDRINEHVYWIDAGVSSLINDDGDAMSRCDQNGGNQTSLPAYALRSPHGVEVITQERCLGFDEIQVFGQFHGWSVNTPSMTQVEPCVWEDTLYVNQGCWMMKFRTGGNLGKPYDYGTCTAENVNCEEPRSGRVCRVPATGAAFGRIHFPVSGNYSFRLDEREQTYEILNIDLIGVEEGPGSGSTVSLSPAQPNPFHESTVIRYTVAQKCRVRLVVHDIAGRLIRVLEEGEREPGPHSVRWDGRDANGVLVPSGVYLYRLEDGSARKVQRAIVIR